MNVTKSLLTAHSKVTSLAPRSVLTGCLAALVACASESGGDGSAGSSGAAGIAGSAGTAGAAGTIAGMAGSAGTAGSTDTAGTAAGTAGTAGTAGSAGTSGTGGASGIAGSAGTSGSGGASGTAGSGGAGGMAGSAGDAGTGGNDDCVEGDGTTERFSFFVTSLAGLRRLSGSENGFGGDLRYGHDDGLSGADTMCTELAETAYPGAGCKTWRAFLSVTEGPEGGPVHAADRIGEGPWYDRLGRLVAMNKTDLLADWPVGADPVIRYDLPNEDGVPNQNPDGTGNIDNHNTVTGTAPGGMLYSMDKAYTCQDWTSSVGTDGTPVIGFSWRGGAGAIAGSSWYSNTGGPGGGGGVITEGGCAAEINLTFEMDWADRGIGARGGYGGFYCLALTP